MAIGPNISVPFGNPLGQPYTAQFGLRSPAVMSTTLTGTFNRQTVDHGRLVFNAAMDPNSFTFDQFALVDPSGNPVNVTSITPVDSTNTQFDVTFDAQSAVGPYTLTVGPNITDPYGNPLTAPFISHFIITNDFLVNGGFETGNFNGWTQSGNPGATGVGTGTVHSGTYAAFLGPGGRGGFLAQTFATTPGATYVLDYWLQHDRRPVRSVPALINGVNIPGSVLNDPVPAFAYAEYTFMFTATGSQTELNFGFPEDPTYFHLADVSV